MPLLHSVAQRVQRNFSLLALVCGLAACATAPRSAPARYVPSARDAALADTVAEHTFRWFWETTDSTTGLVHDRYPTLDFSSVASIGFGLTAYGVGVERGWITREQAARRTLTTFKYLWALPQGPEPSDRGGYQGFFYHFLRYTDGRRFKDVELSTIDTSLLLAGVLFCQSFFDSDAPMERDIREYADSLYRRVNWQWSVTRPPGVVMGWRPETGHMNNDWAGYDEAMILYILALGSPTFPVDSSAWTKWTSTYKWAEYRGPAHVNFGPMFGHQYSHIWIDFRGIRDAYMRNRGIDYFQNSRLATYSQRAYAIKNPRKFAGYDSDVWGLTASDGPADTTITHAGQPLRLHPYWARGVASDGDQDGAERDDGTIAPTAAIGSVVFAPEIVFPAMRTIRERYGSLIFQQYGFLDAFNPTLTSPMPLRMGRIVPGQGWVARDYLGIDQGPIVLMLENWRSELVWRVMKRNPYIVRGLQRAGFTGGWLDTIASAPGTRTP